MALSPNRRLGAYEIVCSLGAGGMGEVYRARDTRLGRDVALKILPPEVVAEAGRLERFDREARAIAALNHPHIVTIFSTEDVDGIRFLTMELVDGCTLSDLIVPSGIPLPRFLEIALPLADALAAAHQKQITHRDLKPGNVMMSNDGRVKVLDFGLARVGGADGGEHSMIATQAPITHQGMIVGTMPYMSPEQVEGRPLDPRTDLFSLGVIFYELLSGERPFTGSSSPALLSAILRDQPSSVCEKRADVPEALDRLVSRLLEKRPEDRVQTARDVFNELRHIKGDRSDGRSDQRSSGRSDRRSTVENLSVAVLPFTVRGADADAEAMAVALTDDVAASLARFSGLSVVASQSTRAFKDSPLDVREIAGRIDARYIIGGNVRKSGAAIRTTTQLIDADSGAQLWSEVYDRRLDGDTDLFAIQDDVTDYIVATLADQGGMLAQSMVRSVQQTAIGDATENQLLVRMWGFQHIPTAPRHAELRAAIEQQLEHQPNNADLWATLANLYVCEHSLLFNPLPDSLSRALRAARRAIEIDRANQAGWLWLGLTHFHLHDRAGLEEAFERATRINSRNSYVMAWAGNILTHVGDYERGTTLTARAMQINPAHPGWVHFAVFNRQFAEGNFEAALQAAHRVNVPTFFWMHFAIAAAAGQLGRIAEGRAAADTMIQIQPAVADEAVLREFITRWYWPEEMIEALLEGVRRSSSGDSTNVQQSEASGSSGVRSKPPSSVSGSLSHRGALAVAVLPFVPRSADEESKSLGDGLTDDITSGLSRFGYLRVLSRSTPAANARYTISGQVRKAGAMLRISATLADTDSGANIWAQNYDRAASDTPFAIQDDVASSVVATLGDQTGVLMRSMAESLAMVPLDQLSNAELVIRFHAYHENVRSDEHLRLRTAFEQALERDPQSAEGWACLAMLYEHEHGLSFNRLPNTQERHRQAAERAVALNPRSQQAWSAMAPVHLFARDRAGVRVAADRVAALNPLNADLVVHTAIFLGLAGDHERALALTNEAMARKPQHPSWYHFVPFNFYYSQGKDEAALREARRFSMPQMPQAHISAAAVAGQLGLHAEARVCVDALRAIDPALATAEAARQAWSPLILDEAFLERLVDGFAKALALYDQVAPSPAKPLSSRPPSSTSGASSQSGALSVVVLPFVPRSSDDESKALADGLTDDITSGLSRFGYLRVLARSLTERLAREHSPMHTQARYAIEGHVRKAGATIRVSVTLVDTQTGTNLWTNTFDRDAAAGTFVLQDEIASATVTTVGDQTGVLVRAMAEAIADKPLDRLSVAELVVRYHMYAESFRADEHGRLRDALEGALTREPRSAEGWACLAMLFEHEHGFGFNPRPDPLQRQRHAAERAIELDPRSQQAWLAMASSYGFSRDLEGLKDAVERAVSINPFNADMVAACAVFLSLAGQLDRSSALVQQAIRHKPQPPGWYHFPMFNLYFMRGDYDAALREIKAVNMPKMPSAQILAAAVSGHLGKAMEAKASLAALRAINPALLEPAAVRGFVAMSLWDDTYTEQLVEGFKKALALVDGRSDARADARSPSIAVLPFTDLSEKKDQDWFCDGIAEEILNALAPLPGLRVAARASAFSLRGKTDDLKSIGEKLNVTTVLEGSVRRAGDRVRITAQLSDTRAGRQLWSERFDRELKDIFDVQEEIARAIVERLKVTLADTGERLVQRHTANVDAYELLLKGRTFLTKRGPAIANAIACFEQAIALDPNLSTAHAGLGDTYRLMGIYGLMPSEQCIPKSRLSLERALALHPNQVDALSALANIKYSYEWDVAAATMLTARALEADPSHVRTLAESSIMTATAMADPPSANLTASVLDRIGQARRLDPLNPWAMAIEAFDLALLGRLPEALEAAARAVAADGGNFTAQWARVVALTWVNRDAEARHAIDEALAMSGRHPNILTELAALNAAGGDRDAAQAVFNELKTRGQTGYVCFAAQAAAAASAGHLDEARSLLRKAIDARDSYLHFCKFPAWRPAWQDARCAALLAEMEYVK